MEGVKEFCKVSGVSPIAIMMRKGRAEVEGWTTSSDPRGRHPCWCWPLIPQCSKWHYMSRFAFVSAWKIHGVLSVLAISDIGSVAGVIIIISVVSAASASSVFSALSFNC
jgi:hypothetical protein